MDKPSYMASDRVKNNYNELMALKSVMNPDPSETEILNSVFIDLNLFNKCVLFDRLNAGTAKGIYGGWIRLCRKGTADAYAIINDNGHGHLFFIETKTKKGVSREAQQDFRERIMGIKNIHYIIVRAKGQVINLIEEKLNA